jgi:hypothetical protein
VNAFFDKSPTKAQAPCVWINQQAAQLRSVRILFIANDGHTADTHSVDFSNPEAFRCGIMAGCEAGEKCGDQRLKFTVPAEFLGILPTILLNRPTYCMALSNCLR